MSRPKVDVDSPEFYRAFKASYEEWQQRNLESAIHTFKTQYIPKGQTEMVAVWRTLDEDKRRYLVNESLKSFMAEAYTNVKLRSAPAVFASIVEVFERAVWDATVGKVDWL